MSKPTKSYHIKKKVRTMSPAQWNTRMWCRDQGKRAKERGQGICPYVQGGHSCKTDDDEYVATVHYMREGWMAGFQGDP